MTAIDMLATLHVTTPDPEAAVEELLAELPVAHATAVVFFCSPVHDGSRIAASLHDAAGGAPVIGCTTAGEFSDVATGVHGVAALALPRSKASRAAAALATYDAGVDAGIVGAIASLEEQLGARLRDLDPERYVGIVLMDGLSNNEERVNELLGQAAPFLTFVGGSAGDDLAFERTSVFLDGAGADDGAALLVLEMEVPFAITKTCSFEPAGRSFRITRADVENRIVWELDGRPATEVYAEAVGVAPDELDSSVFMHSPLGLMIDGEPWIRSPQRIVDGGIKFYCQILEGIDVDLMRSTDMVEATRDALHAAAQQLGGRVSGGLLFNCILRRLEMDHNGAAREFVDAVGRFPVCGFHTYGESYVGHINQTLTGVLIA
jgi:hypothetical protein